MAIVDGKCSDNYIDNILEILRQDMVALITDVDADDADNIVHGVADRLGLGDSLKLKAGLARLGGHRRNIGRYFMSVNQRGDYQFIPPHSEGNSSGGIELAAFFCYENSTDGGETIFMNIDESGKAWNLLREQVRRGRLTSRQLLPHEVLHAKALYHLDLSVDALQGDDQILQAGRTSIADLTVVDVLARPKKMFSRILGRSVYVYWDTIASIDFDSAREYECLLRQSGLLKVPPDGLAPIQMDNAAQRRILHSGVEYIQLFKAKITRKLASGDLVIQNNLTWCHAVTNWTPGSGSRRIVASFA
ncbi:MAG TPA: hypothetical protein VHY84_26765 [Bryobacteraceae bacterium]|nr:hypothetical protein [Bryobacteraceae bacterium]